MEIMEIIKRPKYKSSSRILMIPVNEIQPNPDQPRREFSYEKLLELAQSISENGLLQPITVTLKDCKPVLVAGERRLRAAKIAGIKEIPCIVIEADRSRAALLALLENLQREDMNCFEEAEGIRKLIKDYGLTQEEVAHQLGCAQSTVANRLRILKLTEEERKIIIKEGLSERHARALIRLDGEQRKNALLRIVQQKLNVYQTEKLVEDILEKSKPKERRRQAVPLIRDVRLFLNTVNNAIDTMRRSGIDASAEKIETDDYIEYFVRIPKKKNSTETTKLQRQHITA
ncbi:MAG TPA: ParB/RepB/Spo0J family partition protein [Candidatus Avimonas sp.]|nr:ParB/RepB/Spo0J family partition protein [Candidatus Avimonas sp.]